LSRKNEANEKKQEIINLFRKNVKGKTANTSSSNIKHDGKEGHWLERQMGIKANNRSSSDLFGYEMKKDASKITFGDWSADTYLFKEMEDFTREKFIKIFGKENKLKKRWSWSGEPIPKIDKFNDFGQKLVIDKENNIKAVYSFHNDKRPNKEVIVPAKLQKKEIPLAIWNSMSLEKRIESKFGHNGWFICMKNDEGEYNSIGFGDPLTFIDWIKLVSEGKVFFDSGMYFDKAKPNNRPYSQWRANGVVWHSLIKDSYK
jgi:hypothetical protein